MSDLISRQRVRFELVESTMPKRYRDFCARVIDDENLVPSKDTVYPVFFLGDGKSELEQIFTSIDLAVAYCRKLGNRKYKEMKLSNFINLKDF